jgi:cell division protein FtsB
MSWLVTIAFIAVAFIVHIAHVSNEGRMESRIWDLEQEIERLTEKNTRLAEKFKQIEDEDYVDDDEADVIDNA